MVQLKEDQNVGNRRRGRRRIRSPRHRHDWSRTFATEEEERQYDQLLSLDELEYMAIGTLRLEERLLGTSDTLDNSYYKTMAYLRAKYNLVSKLLIISLCLQFS